jgi:transcriptional regulator of nitric oxide reductase
MRSAAVALLVIAVLLPFAAGQTPLDKALENQLKRVFPGATAFSAKQTSPVPHYVVYTGNPGSPTIAGYAFWTTELEPLERGYDGPIKILVGLDLNAHLTGVLVTENH